MIRHTSVVDQNVEMTILALDLLEECLYGLIIFNINLHRLEATLSLWELSEGLLDRIFRFLKGPPTEQNLI